MKSERSTTHSRTRDSVHDERAAHALCAQRSIMCALCCVCVFCVCCAERSLKYTACGCGSTNGFGGHVCVTSMRRCSSSSTRIKNVAFCMLSPVHVCPFLPLSLPAPTPFHTYALLHCTHAYNIHVVHDMTYTHSNTHTHINYTQLARENYIYNVQDEWVHLMWTTKSRTCPAS